MKTLTFEGRACGRPFSLLRQLAPWVVLVLFATSASNLRAFEYLDALLVDELVAEIAVAAESGVAYVTVTGMEGARLLRVDLETLEVLGQLDLAPEQEISDVVLLHPDGSRLYLSTYQDVPADDANLLEIRRSDFEILRQLSLPSRTYAGVMAPNGENLYLQQVINDQAGLIRVEIDQLTIADELILNPALGFATELAIDPGGSFLLAAVDGVFKSYGGQGGFFRVDLEDLGITALVSDDPLHRHFLSLVLTDDGQTAWTLARESAFWSGTSQSVLLEINPETMTVESSIDLPLGFFSFRSLVLDPNPGRNYAYLADWNHQGWLRADLGTMSVSGQIASMPGADHSRRMVVVGDFAWSAGISRLSRLSLRPIAFFQDRFESDGR